MMIMMMMMMVMMGRNTLGMVVMKWLLPMIQKNELETYVEIHWNKSGCFAVDLLFDIHLTMVFEAISKLKMIKSPWSKAICWKVKKASGAADSAIITNLIPRTLSRILKAGAASNNYEKVTSSALTKRSEAYIFSSRYRGLKMLWQVTRTWKTITMTMNNI